MIIVYSSFGIHTSFITCFFIHHSLVNILDSSISDLVTHSLSQPVASQWPHIWFQRLKSTACTAVVYTYKGHRSHVHVTYDFSDNWSERWGDMVWPTRRQKQSQRHWKRISDLVTLWPKRLILTNWETLIVILRFSDWQPESDLYSIHNSCD